MKRNIILLLIVITTLSCSSDSEQETVSPDALSFDGTVAEIQGKSFAYLYDNYFELRIAASNPTRVIIITFDKYGNFISGETDIDLQYAANYPYYSANYFDFEMEPINISEGKCIIDFSGKVYENRFDMDSASHTISGHFTLQSPLPEPGTDWLQHKGLYANVDGKDWYSPSRFSHAFDSDYWTGYSMSDDEFRLVFNASGTNTPNGQYDFVANTVHNCIKVEKFNTQTLTYEPWNTQGTMNVAAMHQPFQGEFYMTGTFSLTANNPLNPSEVVHFNNGTFNALDL